eukprot:IDg1730t1
MFAAWATRKLGPKKHGLHAFGPIIPEFLILSSYRLYRLKETKKKQLRHLMGEFRRNTAFLEYRIRTKFDGAMPIEILCFLRKFIDTCNRLDIT